MERNQKDKTIIGNPMMVPKVNGEIKVSRLLRASFSESEIENRVLKYTLVTADRGRYKIINHKVRDLTALLDPMKEDERPKPSSGNIFGLKENKENLINGMKEMAPRFYDNIRDPANGFIQGLKNISAEYKSEVKRIMDKYSVMKKDTEDADKIDLLIEEELLNLADKYTNIRDDHTEKLDHIKNKLKEMLRHSKTTAVKQYTIMIDNLECLFSDDILIGRDYCQIPIRDETDSLVSHLHGSLSFENNEVSYHDLGLNITAAIRDRDKKDVTGEDLLHYLTVPDNVIKLDYKKGDQLMILYFGKQVPLVKGVKEDNASFSKRVMTGLKNAAKMSPQYYLTIELKADTR